MLVIRKSKKEKEKEKQIQLEELRESLEQEVKDRLPAEVSTQPERNANESVSVPAVNDETEAKRIIEAILFTASKPVTMAEIKRALNGLAPSKIEHVIRTLQNEYQTDGRSFRIHEIAGGFECATDPKYAPWIKKMELQKRSKQATQSALETLAILAYKQPVTRHEIEELRGVDVSGVLGTLVERKLIKIVGRKEVPGRPFLYGTTDKFLEHFGLKSLDDLPNISEIHQLVEHSVRKEDLLKTEKIVEADVQAQKEAESESSSPETMPADQSGEVSKEHESEPNS